VVTLTRIPDPVLFRVAADVIRTNGWNQGEFFGPGFPWKPLHECPVCVLGALHVAASRLSPEPVNVEAAIGLLRRLTEDLVSDWNDEPDRTVAEVLALLDRAAAAAESARATEAGGSRA